MLFKWSQKVDLATFGTARKSNEVVFREGVDSGTYRRRSADAGNGEQRLVLFECVLVSAGEFGKFHQLFFGEGKMLQGVCGKFL